MHDKVDVDDDYPALFLVVFYPELTSFHLTHLTCLRCPLPLLFRIPFLENDDAGSALKSCELHHSEKGIAPRGSCFNGMEQVTCARSCAPTAELSSCGVQDIVGGRDNDQVSSRHRIMGYTEFSSF